MSRSLTNEHDPERLLEHEKDFSEMAVFKSEKEVISKCNKTNKNYDMSPSTLDDIGDEILDMLLHVTNDQFIRATSSHNL